MRYLSLFSHIVFSPNFISITHILHYLFMLSCSSEYNILWISNDAATYTLSLIRLDLYKRQTYIHLKTLLYYINILIDALIIVLGLISNVSSQITVTSCTRYHVPSNLPPSSLVDPGRPFQFTYQLFHAWTCQQNYPELVHTETLVYIIDKYV